MATVPPKPQPKPAAPPPKAQPNAAPTKVPPKSTAIAKVPPKSTAMVSWEDELAKHAQDASDKEKAPSGQFISVRGGILQVAGSPVEDNVIDVVVIDSRYENVFYKDAFDPDSPTPPHCYAFGETEEGMAPHAESLEPQSEACEGCPQNEWGTAERGKGKACKNVRRLALISHNGLTPENLEEQDVLYLKVSVTSVKAWAHYVKGLASTLRRPPFGVVTQIGVVPDTKTQFKLTFKVVEPLGEEWMAALLTKRDAIKELIEFPYSKPAEHSEEEAKPAKPAKRKF